MAGAIIAVVILVLAAAVWRLAVRKSAESAAEPIAITPAAPEETELERLGLAHVDPARVDLEALRVFDEAEWWKDVWGPDHVAMRPDGSMMIYDWKTEADRFEVVAGPGRGHAI